MVTRFGRSGSAAAPRASVHLKPHKPLIDLTSNKRGSSGVSALFRRASESSDGVAPDFAGLLREDDERKQLLAMARRNSPLEALTVRLLPRTVIPRILDHYATWCVVLAYMTSATLSRLRVGLIFDDFDPSMNDSGNTVITFMIIFYVSYCYQRYTSQFEHADSICHSITNACILARNSFSDDGATPDLHRLWRYLNLMHAIAYCGLTSNYNVDNFFEPLVDKYSLLGFGVDKQEERQHLANVRRLDAEALLIASDCF